MVLASVSRRPLTHLTHFIKQDGGRATTLKNLQDASHRPKVLVLVTSKGESIAREYDH